MESKFPLRVRFAKRRLYAKDGPNNVDCPAHWGMMLPSVAEHFEEYLSRSEHEALLEEARRVAREEFAKEIAHESTFACNETAKAWLLKKARAAREGKG